MKKSSRGRKYQSFSNNVLSSPLLFLKEPSTKSLDKTQALLKPQWGGEECLYSREGSYVKISFEKFPSWLLNSSFLVFLLSSPCVLTHFGMFTDKSCYCILLFHTFSNSWFPFNLFWNIRKVIFIVIVVVVCLF